jgi:hypothetical protein
VNMIAARWTVDQDANVRIRPFVAAGMPRRRKRDVPEVLLANAQEGLTTSRRMRHCPPRVWCHRTT